MTAKWMSQSLKAPNSTYLLHPDKSSSESHIILHCVLFSIGANWPFGLSDMHLDRLYSTSQENQCCPDIDNISYMDSPALCAYFAIP